MIQHNRPTTVETTHATQGGRGRTGVPAPESGEQTLSQSPAPNHQAGINTVKRVDCVPAGLLQGGPHRLPHMPSAMARVSVALSVPVAAQLRHCDGVWVPKPSGLRHTAAVGRLQASRMGSLFSLRQPTCMGGINLTFANGCRAGRLAQQGDMTAEKSKPGAISFHPSDPTLPRVLVNQAANTPRAMIAHSRPRSLLPPGLGPGQ